MKIIKFIISFFIALVLPAAAEDDSGFGNGDNGEVGCVIASISTDGLYLHAMCRHCNSCHLLYSTRINLDWCLANHDGQLVSKEYGNFSKSCKDCHQVTGEGNNSKFTCNCGKDFGAGIVSTTIDLNDIVGIDCAQLTCHGLREDSWDPTGVLPDSPEECGPTHPPRLA